MYLTDQIVQQRDHAAYEVFIVTNLYLCFSLFIVCRVCPLHIPLLVRRLIDRGRSRRGEHGVALAGFLIPSPPLRFRPNSLALPPTEVPLHPVHRRRTTQRSTRPRSNGSTGRRVLGLRAQRRVVTTSSSTSSTSATTRRASAPSSTRATRSTTTLATTTADRLQST